MRTGKFSSLALVALMILSSMLVCARVTVNATPGTELQVINALRGDSWFNFTTDTTEAGDTFVVNITVVDITDLQNWLVKLTWDGNLLSYVDISLPSDNVFSGSGKSIVSPPPEVGADYVWWGCTYINGDHGTPWYWTFNGTGQLCQMELRIRQGVSEVPPTHVSCALTLAGIPSDTFLLDGYGQDITFTAVNGFYDYKWVAPPYMPTLYIKPATCMPVKKGEVFGLEIWVKDVHQAWSIVGFQFSLMWNVTFIEPAAPYYDAGTFVEAFQYYEHGVWYLWEVNAHRRAPSFVNLLPDDYNYSTFGILLGPDSPPSVYHPPFVRGEGKLITVYFKAMYDTVSPIEDWTWIEFIEWTYLGTYDGPEDTYAYNANGHAFAVNTVPCHYRAPQIFSHDVAITDITPSKIVVGQGYSIDINITAENQGLFDETFNITAYANTTIIAKFENVTLTGRDSTTLTFTWNTTDTAFGNHTIWAEATIVPEETDTADNTFVDDTILIEPTVHDVAITDVRIAPNFAYVGENISIQVDAWNIGNMPETFNVTAYADENPDVIGDEITIETQSLFLENKGFCTLTFTWNTTGLSSGNYTISAVASNVQQETDLTNNVYVNGKVGIFVSVPCYDINIICPIYLKLNPSIFQFDWNVRALEVSLGNMTIDSVGYEGLLRVLGSTNDTVHLRVNQPNLEFDNYYLPQSGSIKVPLWLLFDPGTHSGTYELQLTVCGTHRLKITINIVDIWVCQNGAYNVAGGTVTFSYMLEGGSWVYLEAQPNLPPGWSYTVDPPIGTLFETPHQITVDITAAPDAKEGDIGSVTLRAYKNETNILIWQYIFFASVDSKPPTIETIQSPILTFKGDLLFNATVKDASGIESVQLYYSVNDGEWSNQAMQWNSGDTFNSTSYTLTIPHVPDGSTIKYYVVATDWLRNQNQSDIQTITVKYDLAITQVTTSKTIVGKGFTTQVNVTIANEGTIPTTALKISVYANTKLIHTQTIPFLRDGTTTTITFYWNTTDFAKGNYTLSAYAWPILDETDTNDNMLTDATIYVGAPCDVTGYGGVPDGACNMRDIGYFCSKFGTTPSNPNWDPNCDVTGPTPKVPDNTVNMRDIGEACNKFMKPDP